LISGTRQRNPPHGQQCSAERDWRGDNSFAFGAGELASSLLFASSDLFENAARAAM